MIFSTTQSFKSFGAHSLWCNAMLSLNAGQRDLMCQTLLTSDVSPYPLEGMDGAERR